MRWSWDALVPSGVGRRGVRAVDTKLGVVVVSVTHVVPVWPARYMVNERAGQAAQRAGT